MLHVFFIFPQRMSLRIWGAYCDVEVLLIARLDGPLESHVGLSITFTQRQESVALLLVHQRHGLPSSMVVLGEKQSKENVLGQSMWLDIRLYYL